MNEEKYIQGFNNGYLLAEHKPEILKTVTQNLTPSNDYLEGIFDGKGQLEQEKVNAQIQSIEELRNKSFKRENGMEKE